MAVGGQVSFPSWFQRGNTVDEGLSKNFLWTRSGLFNLGSIDILGQIILSVMGAVLCIVRYLAVSLDSYLLDTGSSSPDVIIKNVSRHFTKCPLGVGGTNNLP